MNFQEFKKYLYELGVLSLPILAGNVGQMLINLGDVYVAGHYNTNVLAAISVASAIFMTFIIAGIGLCSAVTPVLSNYRGERRPVRKLFGVTILFSQVLALIFFIILWLFIPLIYKIGLSGEIINDTVDYFKISTFSVFGIFLFTTLKEFLQSHEIVIVPNVFISFSVIINLVLNFIFVYGFWIIPECGAKGLAIASLTVRTLLGAALFLYCINLLKRSVYKNITSYAKDLIKTGAPIAGAMFIEFLGFNIVAVLVGKFNPLYAACHNIIIAITSLSYMIPFSVSSALAVKTGYANGSSNIEDIKKYTLSALYFIFIYAAIAAAIYILFKENLMKAFSSDPEVIKTGASIMIIVACFTAFDGIQGVCIGALKGLKQTVQMLAVMFLSYLLISIPTGLIFAYKFNLVLEGFWLGLAFGLFAASIVSGLLLIRKYFILKKLYSN